MLKVLHTGDWHLTDKNMTELERCLEFLVYTARTDEPDIIIHSGDIFDSALLKADSQAAKLSFKVFEELANIAPVAIIIGTPSHDGQVAEILRYIKARFQVHVSTRPEQIYYNDGFLGAVNPNSFTKPIEAVISMCPAPTKQFFKTQSGIETSDVEIAGQLSAMFAGFAAQANEFDCPHILVGHWNTTGSLISDTQTLTGVDIEISKDQMALAEADLVCLGHIHYPQQIPSSNIFYSGSIASLSWGEIHDHGFYIHDIDDDDLTSCSIKTPCKKRIKLADDLTTGIAIKEVNTHFPMLVPGEVSDACIKIVFDVYQDEVEKVNKAAIKDFYMQEGAEKVEIDINVIPREAVRSRKILELKTLSDKLVEMAALTRETVPDSILAKATRLETESHETILATI